jgi:hypothetical protein
MQWPTLAATEPFQRGRSSGLRGHQPGAVVAGVSDGRASHRYTNAARGRVVAVGPDDRVSHCDVSDVRVSHSWLRGYSNTNAAISLTGSATNGQRQPGGGWQHQQFYEYVSILFILDQKNAKSSWPHQLDQIIGAIFNKQSVIRTPNKKLNGKVQITEPSPPIGVHTYRLTIYCNDKNMLHSSIIVNYFNKFKLKTTKRQSFFAWVQILKLVVNQQPLSSKKLDTVRRLRHNMNYFTISNNPIGQASKS